MTSCSLCAQPLSTHTVREGEEAFCCHGCHTVYAVLCAKGVTDHVDHPLFRAAVDSGLISNPALLEQLRRSESCGETEQKQLSLEVGDLWCPSCAEVIRLVLSGEKGIGVVVVDYATDQAAVTYDPKVISPDAICEQIKKLGYTPIRSGDPRGARIGRMLWLRFSVAAFCAINSMMFAYPIYASYFTSEADASPLLFVWISFFLVLPVVTFSAWPIYKRFWQALWAGIYGMEALVVMSVTAAFGCSVFELFRGGIHVYFDSLSVVVALVLLGKIIESRAKFSAKDALVRLDRALPRKGRKRMDDGSERFFPLKEITVGDHVVVLTGERIPLDGELISGEALVDESALTGESIPIRKKKKDCVLSGGVVKQGRLVLRVVSTEGTTTLHHMIRIVEADIKEKPVVLRAVDRVVQWFVPLVVVLAATTFFGALFLGRSGVSAAMQATTVLLISCPCAIGIAAPLVESQILNALAKLGAIVRNRAVLPSLGKLSCWCFDKTGTVTEGCFRVQSGLEQLGAQARAFLASLSSCSHHPIAVAISEELSENLYEVVEVTEVPGRGVMGKVGERQLALGSELFMKSLSISPIAVKGEGTRAFFAVGGQCIAVVELDDRLKPEIPSLVSALGNCVLLSGDAIAPVRSIAARVGFAWWKAEQAPLEKRECVCELKEQGETVAMVGDGINDAPALTVADVGISVVRASDMSVQVSDILLTTEKLDHLPKMQSLAQRGQRILWQNLAWAFSYNIVGIGLALANRLSPLYAAFAMVCSSLIVLLNAGRIGLNSDVKSRLR